MSTSVEVQRKLVAKKLRGYADLWQRNGEPDIVKATLALYTAFGVEHMQTCDAFAVIADFVDPDGDEVYEGGDLEWTLESLLSED